MFTLMVCHVVLHKQMFALMVRHVCLQKKMFNLMVCHVFTEKNKVHSDGVSCFCLQKKMFTLMVCVCVRVCVFVTEKHVHADGVSFVLRKKLFTHGVCVCFFQKKEYVPVSIKKTKKIADMLRFIFCKICQSSTQIIAFSLIFIGNQSCRPAKNPRTYPLFSYGFAHP